MPVQSFEFEVTDARGRVVRWQGNQLPGRAAWELWKRLSVALLPAVGAAAQQVIGAAAQQVIGGAAQQVIGGADGDVSAVMRLDVGQLLGRMDLARLGASAGDLARTVLEQDADGRLVRDLLRGCRRQDPESGRWEDMSEAVIDRAFAGNLRELLVVLVRVIRENFADFWSGSGSVAPSPAPASGGTPGPTG